VFPVLHHEDIFRLEPVWQEDGMGKVRRYELS